MPYHHFTGDGLNRSEKIQLWIVNQLLETRVPNGKRESSIQWELKHSSGVIQIARLIAQKRGVDAELAEITAALHDVYVIMEGGYDKHAARGAEIARGLLEKTGQFSKAEIRKITTAIKNHSSKHRYSKDCLAELIKDADCLDCFLYGDRIYDDKPPKQLKHYYRRVIRVRKELGLPPKRCFGEGQRALEGEG
ncbi:MAG: HD domain-containing protein [Candidatus Micrarchaeota archaeon]